jgi:hypothetical protein
MPQEKLHPLPREQRDRRRAARFILDGLDAQVESRQYVYPVKLVNLGKLGFSAQSIFEHEVGNRLTLIVNGVEKLPCIVAWTSRQIIGARFLEPLEEEVMLKLMLQEDDNSMEASSLLTEIKST